MDSPSTSAASVEGASTADTAWRVARVARVRLLMRIATLGWAAFTALNASHGRWISAAVDLAVTLATAVAWWVLQRADDPHRDARAVALATHAAAAASALALTGVSLIQGQALSMAVWYLVALPLYAAHASGRRASAWWSAVAVAGFAVVLLSGRVVRIRPEFVHQDFEVFFGAAVLVAVVYAFAAASQRIHERQVAELRASEAALAKQAADLALARDGAMSGARAKSEFLATMSHEIRTPLNGISGMAQVLASSALDAEQRRCLDAILRSAAALRLLVDDVLDLSKIEAGHLELNRTRTDVSALVGDVFHAIEPLAAAKGLRLERAVDPAVPCVVVLDARRLRQVLLNVVGNAIKFTERGGVDVRVERAEPVANGAPPRLRFAVRDTGVGVPEDKLAAIFLPFVQADPSAGRRHEGTGLGLAICRQLCAAMGGEIWAESEAGRGATFFFTVEAQPDDGRDAGDDAALAPAVRSPPPQHARARADGRVLVVEDHEVNRLVARSLLARAGVAVDLAPSGAEALEALRTRDYPLVFMDVRMPGLDGLETTRRIRASLPRERQPRIAAMTANAMPEDRERCREAGMDDFVAKPFEYGDLLAALERAGLLEPAPRLAPARAPEQPPGQAPAGAASTSAASRALTELRALCADQPGAFEDIIAEYRARTGELVQRVADAVARGAREEVRRTAHTIRGSAGTLGHHALGALAERVERAATTGGTADLEALGRELAGAWRDALADLDANASAAA